MCMYVMVMHTNIDGSTSTGASLVGFVHTIEIQNVPVFLAIMRHATTFGRRWAYD